MSFSYEINNCIFIFSTKSKIDLQLEVTRYIYTQLKRLNSNGTTVLINCPTVFDGKESIIKLILGLITISDTMINAFSLINKIINVKILFCLFKFNLFYIGNEYDTS